MSDTEETKVVQTEVPASLYERFTAAGRDRGLTSKEAMAEAIEEFVHRYQPVDPDDPLFIPLEWEAEDPNQADDASERVDELAYGHFEEP